MFQKGEFDSKMIFITYSRTPWSGSVARHPTFLQFLTPLPQRIYRLCSMSIFSRVLLSDGSGGPEFDECLHTFSFNSIDQIITNYAIQRANVIFFLLMYSCRSTGLIRRCKYHETTYVSLFLQNERNPGQYEAWKLWIFKIQLFSTSSNLQNNFAQTNFLELIFHS